METRTFEVAAFEGLVASIEDQQDACRKHAPAAYVGWGVILTEMRKVDCRPFKVVHVCLAQDHWDAIDDFADTIGKDYR